MFCWQLSFQNCRVNQTVTFSDEIKQHCINGCVFVRNLGKFSIQWLFKDLKWSKCHRIEGTYFLMSNQAKILTGNALSITLEFLPVTLHNSNRFKVMKFSDSILIRKFSATYSFFFQVIVPKNHAMFEFTIWLLKILKLYDKEINFKSKESNF